MVPIGAAGLDKICLKYVWSLDSTRSVRVGLSAAQSPVRMSRLTSASSRCQSATDVYRHQLIYQA